MLFFREGTKYHFPTEGSWPIESEVRLRVMTQDRKVRCLSIWTDIHRTRTGSDPVLKEKKEGVVERMHWLHNRVAAIWSPTEFRCRNTFLDLWCNLPGFVADQVKTDLCMEKAALSLTQCNVFSEEGSASLCLHFLALKRSFVMWALTNFINTRLWRKDGRSLQLGL